MEKGNQHCRLLTLWQKNKNFKRFLLKDKSMVPYEYKDRVIINIESTLNHSKAHRVMQADKSKQSYEEENNM